MQGLGDGEAAEEPAKRGPGRPRKTPAPEAAPAAVAPVAASQPVAPLPSAPVAVEQPDLFDDPEPAPAAAPKVNTAVGFNPPASELSKPRVGDLLRYLAQDAHASELCVGGRGTARYPRRAAGHFAEGLFCPPAGGAPALLDGRNPLEYLSTGSSYAPRVHRVDIGSSDDVSTSCDSSSPTDTSHLHFWGHRSSVWQSIRADNLRWHDLRPPSCTDSDRRILES